MQNERSKILLITHIFPPKTGGSGRWFWEIYTRMPRDEVVVTAPPSLGCDRFDESHDLNIQRMSLLPSDWGTFSFAGFRDYRRIAKRLKQLILSQGIQAIHCGSLLPEGWLGRMLAKSLKLPYTVFLHGEEIAYCNSSRQLKWMGRRVVRYAHRVVANSRNTQRILQEYWQADAERVSLLHPGVDTKRFIPGPPDSQTRKVLGWNDRPVILTVSRLQKRKGHDTLLRALPAIRRHIPDVLYAIVGDGDERPKLERMVHELELSNNVQFRGETDEDEMLRCYQQCDLFVLPNREINGDFEGFGMVLVEAQACAKPVVAGTSGGTSETMSIPETGLTVDCNTPDKLAETVTELLLDENRREQMGQAGRKWVVDNFDWDSLSRQAYNLFQNKPFPAPATEKEATMARP